MRESWEIGATNVAEKVRNAGGQRMPGGRHVSDVCVGRPCVWWMESKSVDINPGLQNQKRK